MKTGNIFTCGGDVKYNFERPNMKIVTKLKETADADADNDNDNDDADADSDDADDNDGELVGGGLEVKQMASSTTSNRHFVRFTLMVLIFVFIMMMMMMMMTRKGEEVQVYLIRGGMIRVQMYKKFSVFKSS